MLPTNKQTNKATIQMRIYPYLIRFFFSGYFSTKEIDERTNGQVDGLMDKAFFRDAWSRIKS